jgi:hypothetical protein
MKTIETLVEDMNCVIKGEGGWDATVTKFLSDSVAEVADARFGSPPESRGYLSLSALGTPCSRKLWYKVNEPKKAEPLSPNTLLKFFFGDIIEALALSLAKAAGHQVTGMQDRLDVHGIKGHRDAVIDGVTVDVKSTSSMAFKKFKEGKLREDDPFGYISQLSSYVYGGKDDPLVADKNRGAFLAIDKQNGHVCLDVYDFDEELQTKEQEVERIKASVAGSIPEDRIPPVPQSKTSKNTKLDMQCSYCEFKKVCWPEARVFLYSNGPVFLVDVVDEPRVFEVTDGNS